MINRLQNAVFSWQINYDLMILTDASECDHENQAAAVIEADVNSRIRREILSFTESDDEWHDIHHAEVLFCESVKQQS